MKKKCFVIILSLLAIVLTACGIQKNSNKDAPPKPDFKAKAEKGITEEDSQTAVKLGETMIRRYFEAIEKEEQPQFSEILYSGNLSKYLEEKIRIIKAEREKLKVSSSEKNDTVEVLESKIIGEAYYIKFSHTKGGGTTPCHMLIVNDKGALKVGDIYFEVVDGIDEYTTGMLGDIRKISDSELWNDKAWFAEVMNKLEVFEAGVGSDVAVPMYLY